MKNIQAKSLILLGATALTLLGCGGGSTTPTTTITTETETEPYYNVYVPLEDKPQSYICKVASSDDENNATLSTMYRLYSIDGEEACESYAQTWLENFNHEDEPTINPEEQQAGLDYINTIRGYIGLPKFKHNKELEEANRLHALYLKDVYDTFGVNMTHYEDNASYPSEYYRGDSGTDRAIASNYSPAYWAGEDISFGSDTSTESIDYLLTLIYHRNALLWNWVDDIGIGVGKGEESGFHAEGQLFGIKYDNRIGFLQSISPAMVCFPFELQGGVRREYNGGETPSPLPDISGWVGNPISVAFNSYKVGSVEMTSFKLYKVENYNDETESGDETEITNTRILTKETDPAERFSGFEFALFPLDVLESQTIYKVSFCWNETAFSGEVEGKCKEWLFQTRE